MIQQNNIKDFSIAAFRYYGHRENENITGVTELQISAAVENTFRHLQIEDDSDCVKIVQQIYCALPLGNIRKGLISKYVVSVGTLMNMDERTIWRKLRRARELFNKYYTYGFDKKQ